MLIDLLRELLANEGVIASVVAWLLTLVPGPFRGIARWLIDWLRQRALHELERRREEAATVAVEYVEQVLPNAANQEKLSTAVTIVQNTTGAARDEARAYVEAAVYEMKRRDARLDELEAKLAR